MERKHRDRLLEQMPEEKREEKRAKTRTGLVLVALAFLAAFGSFLLAKELILSEQEITKWSMLVVSLPLAAGFGLAVMGGHVWSGEYMAAAMKDMMEAFRVFWSRNGADS